jgi:DNA-binding CsgD family transcriptional regulator
MLFIRKAIKQSHWENKLLQTITIDGTRPAVFQENCQRFGLTKTEVKIVEMLYEGMTNRSIAEKIFISEETVKKHIQNMFRKTGVKNRTALIHLLQH